MKEAVGKAQRHAGHRPGRDETWGAVARGVPSAATPVQVFAKIWSSRLVAAVPFTGHVMSQASAMSPPLCSLLLALGLGLAGTLNPNDPNTCSFWER